LDEIGRMPEGWRGDVSRRERGYVRGGDIV
jgi:hypothetical protein